MSIKITSTIAVSLALSVLLLAMPSCKKDKSSDNGLVELKSFGPAGVKHGEQIRFLGRNLDKVTAIVLGGATVDQKSFVFQTKDSIGLIVPQASVRGKAVLKTPDGDITSKAFIDFEVGVTIADFPDHAKPGDQITITGAYLNWITGIKFARDTTVTQFVSVAHDQLVVTVPITAETGTLIFYTTGTEPLEIETETMLELTEPTLMSLSPNPVERGGVLTIQGTDLDLVESVSFAGVQTPITSFASKSESEITVTVPENAGKGYVSIKSYSGITVTSTEVLLLAGDLPPLPAFPLALYTDGLENGFQDWSWTAGKDFGSNEQVRDGLKAIKATYGENGYEGISLHSDVGVSTAGYTKLEFSIYGSPGLDGKKLNLVVNGDWGNAYKSTIKEGEWQTITFNLADIGAPDPLKELIFQSDGWSGVLYIDHVGLR
ncbi:MAG: IPT/TIG domain-containing protein [Candidatus Pseudobacter hemicellulosilyticus]|uniref:IPT/TIG domain-containing protein n=1 Tax=Candidatus Pseudobacter hemicellulosilyticus TaxID=3121375 RepID=A0AAJ6BFU4_9BACT|nr:MAG: IPT/TIG domain-containing protein [Pseudobacter sp.]